MCHPCQRAVCHAGGVLDYLPKALKRLASFHEPFPMLRLVDVETEPETDEAAYEILKRMRWPSTNGVPFCPKCASLHVYLIRSRGSYRCPPPCGHDFTLTSGTPFNACKLTDLQLYRGVSGLLSRPFDKSASAVGRDAGIGIKTIGLMAARLEAYRYDYTQNVFCSNCKKLHDGSVMRWDKRSKRSKEIIETFPMTEDGRMQLCRECQRLAWFAGGYEHFLVDEIERETGHIHPNKITWRRQ